MIPITHLDAGIVNDGKIDVTAKLIDVFDKAIREHIHLLIPNGEYLVSDRLATLLNDEALSITGDSCTNTIIKCRSEDPLTLFKVQGTEDYSFPKNSAARGLVVKNINLMGTRREVTFVDFSFAAHCYFEDVLFSFTTASAITGYEWWDSTFSRCHFVVCGDGPGKPVVLMEGARNNENVRCNNNCFDLCRWEACPAVGVFFGQQAIKNRLTSCKFDRVDYPLIFDRAYANIVNNCQFVDMGSATDSRAAISIHESEGIIVTGNIIDGYPHGIVAAHGSKYCVVTGNVIGLRRPCKKEAIVAPQPLAGSIIKDNAVRSK